MPHRSPISSVTPFRTVARPVAIEGVGLFCACRCAVTIRPAGAGQGVRLSRVDLPGAPGVLATAASVLARPRQTVLRLTGEPGETIQTVEHLLSALVGVGITDALIEVHGPEIPLADGSAKPFVDAILAAGVVDSPAGPGPALASRPIVVATPLEVGEGDARLVALPANGPFLDITYDLDYGPGAPMSPQSAYYRHNYDQPDAQAYARDIAPARTFTTAAEAQQLRAAGLFAHLAPGDVVVLGPDGPVGCELRFANEPARHKLLDVMGDLALAGRPIHARVNAARSGHALNQRMALALASLP